MGPILAAFTVDSFCVGPPMDQRLADRGRKGRGAWRNPAGRFLPIHAEAVDDGWGGLEAQAAEDPTPETVSVERARSALAYNSSPDVPFDRALNPYRGCAHGCVYCFARPTHGTLGWSAGLDFETRLVAREGLAEALRAELSRPGYRPAPVYLSGVTDAYQPLERSRRLTRAALEVLAAARHPVVIVTKGALVTRDLDLLAPMAADGLAQVCVSITTLDRDLARRLEPRAAAPHARLDALRRLSEAGVPAAALMAPIIAGLTDHEIERLLAAAADAGATSAHHTLLRLPSELTTLWEDWLDVHAPDAKARVLRLQREMRGGRLNDPRFGARMRGQGPRYALIAQRFALARKRLGLGGARAALRCDLFRPPPRDPAQGELFA